MASTDHSNNSTLAVRPIISMERARTIFSEFYDQTEVLTLKEFDSYSDRNFYFRVASGEDFVLKIMNEQDSNLAYMMAISDLLVFLDTKKFTFQIPQPVTSKYGKYIEMVSLVPDGEAKLSAVLLTFVPGLMFKEFYKGKEFDFKGIYDIGKQLGQFIQALNEFKSPGLDFRNGYLWDTANSHKTEQYFSKIQDFIPKKDLDLLKKYFDLFMQELKPILHSLPPSTVHSDLNEMNLLVDENGALSGIIDYTDTVYSYRLFDIGNCTAYIMMHSFTEGCDPFKVSRYLIQGFLTELALTQSEREHLLLAVTSRLMMSTVLGYYHYSVEPTNEYLLTTPKPAFNLLRHIDTYAKADVEKIWFEPIV